VSTNINNQRIHNVYDAFGRLAQIFGPYQPDNGPATLAMTYALDLSGIPFAQTDHIDRDASVAVKDPISMIGFTDRLKRALRIQSQHIFC
jgi:hypothetical protein